MEHPGYDYSGECQLFLFDRASTFQAYYLMLLSESESDTLNRDGKIFTRQLKK